MFTIALADEFCMLPGHGRMQRSCAHTRMAALRMARLMPVGTIAMRDGSLSLSSAPAEIT